MPKPTIMTCIDVGTSDGSSRVMRTFAQRSPPRQIRGIIVDDLKHDAALFHDAEWSSLEGDLRLAACTGPTGHVTLKYQLQQPFTGFHWEPEGT
jgi:hypothetical protein